MKFTPFMLLLVAGLFIVAGSSCTREKDMKKIEETGEGGAESSLFQTATAVFNGNCVSCHGGDTPRANLRLNVYADMKRVADNGRLREVLEKNIMPPTGPLSADNKKIVFDWIEAGAPAK